MARRKNAPESIWTKGRLAERLRTVRSELFGERGGPELARRLGLPVRTWYNYEIGVTVPAEVLLRFVELTGVEPMWLLHGKGQQYRSSAAAPADGTPGKSSVESLLRRALNRLAEQSPSRTVAFDERPIELGADRADADPSSMLFVPLDPADGEDWPGFVAARREWLDGEAAIRTVIVGDSAMEPLLPLGSFVAYDDAVPDLDELDGALVVAWLDEGVVVRWLQFAGRFAVLRAEDPGFETTVQPIDREGLDEPRTLLRRALWSCSPR